MVDKGEVAVEFVIVEFVAICLDYVENGLVVFVSNSGCESHRLHAVYVCYEFAAGPTCLGEIDFLAFGATFDSYCATNEGQVSAALERIRLCQQWIARLFVLYIQLVFAQQHAFDRGGWSVNCDLCLVAGLGLYAVAEYDVGCLLLWADEVPGAGGLRCCGWRLIGGGGGCC